MADITLNSAVRSNLRTMQSTQDLMNRTEERLSTGKKVNSALDNPSNFFTAQTLDRRAGDLGNLLDNVATSVKTLQAADNGIKAISKLVDQMKSAARSAQQSSSAVDTRAAVTSAAITGSTATDLIGTDYQAVTGSAVDNNLTAAEPITGATKLSGAANSDSLSTAVANGDTLTVAGETIRFYTDAAALAADTANDDDAAKLLITDDVDEVLGAITDILGDGSSATVADGVISVKTATGGEAFTFGGDAAAKLGLPTTESVSTNDLTGKTLSISVGGGTAKEITFGRDAAGGQINTLDALNAELKSIGARASLSEDGELKIDTLNANEADSIKVSGTAVSTDGTAAGGEVFQFATEAASTAEAVIGDDSRRVNFKNDYNDLLSQISQLAADSSFNGVNLLSGDNLKVTFNETGDSSLSVEGVKILETLGLEDIGDADFLDSGSIDAVLGKLGDALDSLNGQSSKFGTQLSVVQTRQTFTKDMIGTLQDGALALTGADTNEEAANLATLQTRQSLIVSALSISTSQEQNVLQLLR